ncbi:hypothetical protein ACET7V_05295 [Aeromonas sanarellii]|uniref:hypothetical protein n=1 Tax=Aeromonas sanarellii TaxID=633415 RepID=UPI0038D04085
MEKNIALATENTVSGRNQSAYMLEAAFDYLRAAKVLWLQENLKRVAMVNAAIAIEIMLKSFIAQPVENERGGTVGEQYEITGKRLHSLVELAGEIDSEIYCKLNFGIYEGFFDKYKELFIEARYPYEPGSRVGFNDEPIDVGIAIFKAIMKWYKETGNSDPWVLTYPEVVGGQL